MKERAAYECAGRVLGCRREVAADFCSAPPLCEDGAGNGRSEVFGEHPVGVKPINDTLRRCHHIGRDFRGDRHFTPAKCSAVTETTTPTKTHTSTAIH